MAIYLVYHSNYGNQAKSISIKYIFILSLLHKLPFHNPGPQPPYRRPQQSLRILDQRLLGLGACKEREPPLGVQDGNLSLKQGKPHPNTRPGTLTESLKSIPRHWMKNTHNQNKRFKSYLRIPCRFLLLTEMLWPELLRMREVLGVIVKSLGRPGHQIILLDDNVCPRKEIVLCA